MACVVYQVCSNRCLQHSGRVNARQIHGILQCSATHSNAGLETRRQVLTGPLWRDVSSPVRIVVSHTMGRKAQPPPDNHRLPRGAKPPSPAFPCFVALPCESNCFSFSLSLSHSRAYEEKAGSRLLPRPVSEGLQCIPELVCSLRSSSPPTADCSTATKFSAATLGREASGAAKVSGQAG